jgi:hypothetical protein
MLRIKDPAITIIAGRPCGRANYTRKDPKVVAVKEAAAANLAKQLIRRSTRFSRSTKRDPSGFEIIRKRTERIARGGLAKGAKEAEGVVRGRKGQ